MYGKKTNIKVIIKDFITNDLILIHEEPAFVSMDVASNVSSVRAKGFELIPFKGGEMGHLTFAPKDFSIELMTLLTGSEMKAEEKTIEIIERVDFDSNGEGQISREPSTTKIQIKNNNFNLKVPKNGKVVSNGPKGQTAYCIYGVNMSVDKLKWEPREQNKYFKIELQIPLESKTGKGKYSNLLVLIHKTYLENKVGILDALLKGEFAETPLIFRPLEVRNFETIEFIFI